MLDDFSIFSKLKNTFKNTIDTRRASIDTRISIDSTSTFVQDDQNDQDDLDQYSVSDKLISSGFLDLGLKLPKKHYFKRIKIFLKVTKAAIVIVKNVKVLKLINTCTIIKRKLNLKKQFKKSIQKVKDSCKKKIKRNRKAKIKKKSKKSKRKKQNLLRYLCCIG